MARLPALGSFFHARLSRAFAWSTALGCVGLFLGSCHSAPPLTVDSLAKPNAADAVSYELNIKDPTTPADSLRHQEATGYVRTALSGKGMYEAPRGVKPDVVIDVEYGMGPPETKIEIRSEPVYRTMPGSVRTEVKSTPDGSSRTVTVREEPTKELVGHQEYEVVATVYEKFLKLTARENAETTEGRPPAEIWTVDVTSEGRSRDLRKTLPVLVAATIDYIGKDSRGQKTIRLKDAAADVVFVKQGK